MLFLVLAPPRSPRKTSWNPRGTLVEIWSNPLGPYLGAATTLEPETPKLSAVRGKIFLTKWKLLQGRKKGYFLPVPGRCFPRSAEGSPGNHSYHPTSPPPPPKAQEREKSSPHENPMQCQGQRSVDGCEIRFSRHRSETLE